ncbi:hypothetical protein HNR21_002805 [Actinomadura cellulosilytica]|uniref:Uncharacterized protein n=1 Tax=Thermomonospora cellulosilytica TaxID=1411118 RepID=A0A7W3MXZ4_9ACTN|nr:hypothetical protein [Thermomonospora cellulosilytica]
MLGERRAVAVLRGLRRRARRRGDRPPVMRTRW